MMNWDYTEENDDITPAEFKGNYLLFLELDKDMKINVGKLGRINFQKGIYVYVGSAMAGFCRRIPRYFRKDRKKHWHIDYLLDHAKILYIFLIPSKENLEEKIAKILSKIAEPIPKFGCTDKKSISHLFRIKEEDIGKILRGFLKHTKN